MLKLLKVNLILFLILLSGLFLRLISLNQSFWLDETTSGYIARDLSFVQIINLFSPGDFHPPLYYFILKIWGSIFGFSELGLRSLSLVSGVISIFVLYKIAGLLKSKTIVGKLKFAEVTAILLATSGLHIYFSQEARMYILASLFVLLSFYFFVKNIQKGGVGDMLLFGLFIALSVMTHYQTIFMIPVFWILGKIYNKNFNWWKLFLASHIILLFFLALWLPVFLKQLSIGFAVQGGAPGWWLVLGKTDFKQLLLVPVKFIIGRITLANNSIYLIVSGVLLAIYSWILLRFPKGDRDIKIIWVWFLIPVIISAVVGLKIAIFTYARLIFVLPAFYLLLAYSISVIRIRYRLLILSFLILVNISTSLIYLTNPRFQREDWRGLIRNINNSRDNQIVLLPSRTGTEAFRYYDRENRINVSVKSFKNDNYDIIWLMRYVQPIFDPNDNLRALVESKGYKKEAELDFNGVVVWKYKK